MSTTGSIDPVRFAEQVLPRYAKSTGPDRYARFIEEILELERTFPQDRILRALDQHKQVVVVAANGLGKSYIAAAGGVAALYCNKDTIVNVTAGTSGTLKTNIWKPARSLFRSSVLHDVLPGRTMDGDREIRTGFDEEWFLECVSPKYPDDLEGPHNDHVIYIVEEADKPGVTDEHIDSVRSTGTDDDDRVLVIANPPKDETNVVYDLMRSEQWHTLRFATWDSHNVRVDRDLEDREKIGGLADTSKLVDDWQEYHGEEWPGLERAIEISSPYLAADGTPTVDPRRARTDDDGEPVENPEFREDLHERWYRRRAGIMPPGDATTHRPLSVDLIEQGYEPTRSPSRETPESLGIDVARSADDTVAIGPHGDHLVVHYDKQGSDHSQQEADLAAEIRDWPTMQLAVDAVGEGSGLADGLDNRFGTVHRFKNSSVAADATTYDRCWGESLALFADFLKAGGTFSSRDLYEQAKVAARTVTWEEKELDNRGQHGAKVLSASSKEDVKDRLGRSPDHFDAALMAVWVRDAETQDHRAQSATISW